MSVILASREIVRCREIVQHMIWPELKQFKIQINLFVQVALSWSCFHININK